MKYTTLGKTDIKVSRLCVGCMSYGKPTEDFHLWTLEQPETQEMVKQAIDLGVNFFDTANCYAHGTSEQYLGTSLKNLGIKREDVVIASKVYFNAGCLSKEAIHREIEGTLERLGTDYLDLYQIHRYDYDHPIEETMEALDSLVKAGKVRAIGASAMYGYQFHNMQICAEKNGFTPFSTMQNHYNLLYREDERELIPVCNQYGVSRIPYSPLAGGHLSHTGWTSGSKRSETDKSIRQKYDASKENDLQIIARVEELSKRLGVSMTVVSLAWQYAKGVAAPIVGATNPVHFKDATKAVDLKLSEEDVAFLEEPYRAHEIVGALDKSLSLENVMPKKKEISKVTQEKMETRKLIAAEKKASGKYNCAQAVLCTYSDLTGIDEETCKNLCQSFAAGMGNMEGTCGALVGAGITLGMITKDKVKAMKGMKQMMSKFQERNHSTTCKVLKGIETKLVLRECPLCVADACEFLEEIIDGQEK